MTAIFGRGFDAARAGLGRLVNTQRLTSLSALLVLLELVALEKDEREMSTVTAISSDVTSAATDVRGELPATWTSCDRLAADGFCHKRLIFTNK